MAQEYFESGVYRCSSQLFWVDGRFRAAHRGKVIVYLIGKAGLIEDMTRIEGIEPATAEEWEKFGEALRCLSKSSKRDEVLRLYKRQHWIKFRPELTSALSPA